MQLRAAFAGAGILSAAISCCTSHYVDLAAFRQIPLGQQIQEYERGFREHCIQHEGGRGILLTEIADHEMQSADAMAELLRHPSRDFPLGDVMDVIEFVHFGGTRLNNHEVMHELARIAQTATDPEIRERARLAIESIGTNDPLR